MAWRWGAWARLQKGVGATWERGTKWESRGPPLWGTWRSSCGLKGCCSWIMKDKKSPPECPSSVGSQSPALGNGFLGGEASGLFKWCSCNPEGPLVQNVLRISRWQWPSAKHRAFLFFFFKGGLSEQPLEARPACSPACMLSHFSHVQLFATLWTVAHQAPLSMGFSRQEY